MKSSKWSDGKSDLQNFMSDITSKVFDVLKNAHIKRTNTEILVYCIIKNSVCILK